MENLRAQRECCRKNVLTDHKYPEENWPEEEFRDQSVELAGGETVAMRLAERGARMTVGFSMRTDYNSPRIYPPVTPSVQPAVVECEYYGRRRARDRLAIEAAHWVFL